MLLLFLHNGKTTDKLLKEAYELSKVPKDRELDVLLSSGEQVSISKLSILLNELGYDSISLTGWQAGIYTNNTNQNAIIENIDTERILSELSKRKIVIVAGFQGFNDNLDITTLGRGGSDTTAVAISASLNAKHCYIYSDVDGVYSTDPNKISSAKKLEHLSYVEMLDISNEGAKVLHNRCVEIGEKYNIPIITKSTFNNKTGSVISDKLESKVIKSIVKNDDLMLVNLKNNVYSFEAINNIYNILISNNILPIQFVNKQTLSLDVEFLAKVNSLNKLKLIIEKHFKEYESLFKDVSRIAVVGYGITNDSSVLTSIMDIVNNYDIDIYNIDITNTKIIITFKEQIDNNLLEILHEKLFKW